MHEEILRSRAAVSRRRALGIGGSIGLGALLAACGGSSRTDTPAASDGATIEPTTPSGDTLIAKLDSVGQCGLQTEEVTQGPYWFDVDTIRSDIREDRPGTTLSLALRVQDADCEPVPNAVVEIWHCDAGGVYSGFEVASTGGGGSGGGPGGSGGPGDGGAGGSGGPGGTDGASGGPGEANDDGGQDAPGDGGSGESGEVSDGSYSSGVSEATPTDDGTYLRGAQVADANGIVQFTTIWPGWYVSRTVHIHLKVHVDRENVLTGQIGFDDDLNELVYQDSPYDEHTGRDTYNDQDSIIDDSMIAPAEQQDDGSWLAYHNLGVSV